MLHLLLEGTLLEQVFSESKSKEGVKKLMSVLATSIPMTWTKEEAVEAIKSVGTAEAVETAKVGKDGKESEGEYLNLTQVPCIRYLITHRKKSESALLDSGSEVNTIHPTLARKLRLSIRPTDFRAQKINGIMLDTNKMVVTAFLVTDKANRV